MYKPNCYKCGKSINRQRDNFYTLKRKYWCRDCYNKREALYGTLVVVFVLISYILFPILCYWVVRWLY